LNEHELPLSERILITLHNLGATTADMAKKADELAQFVQADINEINPILDRLVSEGYASSLINGGGNKKHYLTRTGIIRVCSLFS
jgi:DNA-binding PadR family transcriptional regulator